MPSFAARLIVPNPSVRADNRSQLGHFLAEVVARVNIVAAVAGLGQCSVTVRLSDAAIP
jgi:hypothetical protein